MHEALGHPSEKAFMNMIKTSEFFENDVTHLVNKLYQNCMVCFKFKKVRPKPKVSPPMSNQVNETIAMDLKIWPKFNV